MTLTIPGTGNTTTFPVALPPPTRTNRPLGRAAAIDCTVATSTAPTATITPQRCCTRLFAIGVTDPTVPAAPVGADKYDTCARVAVEADSMPDHTTRAAGSASPAGPVSKHAVNETYCLVRAGGS